MGNASKIALAERRELFSRIRMHVRSLKAFVDDLSLVAKPKELKTVEQFRLALSEWDAGINELEQEMVHGE